MSDQAATGQSRGWGPVMRWGISIALIFGVIAVAMGPAGLRFIGQTAAQGRLHAPDFALIARAPLVIQLHLATVLTGFVLGTVQMIAPKGTVPHRALGWVFVVFMLFTAIDALFIKDGATWRVTPIQIFSVVVLVSIPLGVIAARRHRVTSHASAMRGLYFGGLIIAGFVAFLPGRLMWRVFFG